MTTDRGDVERWIERHGANPSTVFAGVLVDALAAAGVRGVAVGSGSRSTPLVDALVRDGRFDVVPAYDERSAGFYALGWARASGQPALVVTTSGTATANLFPAVIEASQSGAQLVVVTADRPLRLRGTDANQTIDQEGLYGRYVRFFRDLSASADRAGLVAAREAVRAARARAAGDPPGPVHLNVRFDKPLEPTRVQGTLPANAASWEDALLGLAADADADRGTGDRDREGSGESPAGGPGGTAAPELLDALGAAQRPLLVCGPLRGAAGTGAVALARRTGIPLLADPLSGARFRPGTPALPHYDLWLEPWAATAPPPDLVLRVGRAPTSAAVHRFLTNLPRSSRQVLLTEESGWTDHLMRAHAIWARGACWLEESETVDHLATAAGDPHGAWAAGLTEAAAITADRVSRALERPGFEPAAVLGGLSGAPPESIVFVGNSNVIRDVDAYDPGGRALRAIGFRGASGIDGNLSGALGATRAAAATGVAVVGDMTFLHDANALALAREPGTSLTIVVIHNDGGGIFHRLPVRRFDPPFERHIVMPHGIDPADVAEAYGLRAVRLERTLDVSPAVREASSSGRVTVIRVRTDREAGTEERRRLSREIHAAFDPDL